MLSIRAHNGTMTTVTHLPACGYKFAAAPGEVYSAGNHAPRGSPAAGRMAGARLEKDRVTLCRAKLVHSP